MTILLFAKITIVCLLGAMSPGPSMVVVINNAIYKNRINGILTAIGHGF
jgi:LysE type translocator.